MLLLVRDLFLFLPIRCGWSPLPVESSSLLLYSELLLASDVTIARALVFLVFLTLPLVAGAAEVELAELVGILLLPALAFAGSALNLTGFRDCRPDFLGGAISVSLFLHAHI